MAIEWGSWVGTSPKQMRLGVEYLSVPAPTSSTQTSVTVKARIWIQCYNWFYDSNNLFKYWGTLGNNGTGSSKSINISAMRGTQALQDISKVVPLNSSGTTPVSVSSSLTRVEYVGYSLTATVTKGATIPAKTTSVKPASPSSITATFVSDTTTDLSWPAVAGATDYIVQRYDYLNTSAGYVTQATPKTTTYRSTTGMANNRYRWRVYARNSAGTSGTPTYSSDIYTTPAPPTDIRAMKVGSGIEVSLVDRSPWNTGWDWQVSSDGGPWTGLGSSSNASTTYQHVSPDPLQEHEYRARSTIGTRVSAWSVPSAPVKLAAPPGRPTLLSPKNTVSESLTTIPFQWRHNPIDTTAQTAANLQYRLVGSSTWVSHTVTGSSEEYQLPNTLAVGTYEWQVQTKGQHPSYGDWSTLGIFEVGSDPVVDLLSPTGTLTSSRVPFQWTFSDEDSDLQVSARMVLINTATNSEVWSGSIQGNATSHTPSYRIPEGSYRAEITVTDGSGLTGTDSSTFTVAYTPPAVPLLGVVWVRDTLSTEITASSQTGAVATVEMQVQRSFDGLDWEDNSYPLPAGTHTITDVLTPLNQVVHYRVVAFSADGAESESETLSVFSESLEGVINYGPGWANRLVLKCNVSLGVSLNGYAIEHVFSERALPVSVYDLDHEAPLVLSVSATSPYTPIPHLVEIFKHHLLRQDIWWRDFEKNSFGGRIGGFSANSNPSPRVGMAEADNNDGHPTIQFTVSQTDVR